MKWFAKRQAAGQPPAAPNQDKMVKFLSQPLLLEEAGPPRALSHLILVVSLLIGGLIGLAALTEVSETAVVQGQIMPAGSVNLVQHLEGGIVAEILVEDGQVVKAGQTLIRLEEAAAQAELEQVRAREIGLALRAERLRAFVLDRTADFSFASQYPELVEDQGAILEMQITSRDSQRQVNLSRIDQRKAELRTLAKEQASLRQQVEIIEEQAEMRRKLLDKGLVSRVVYLETERALSKARGELASVRGRSMQTKASLAEAQNTLLELNASLRNDALSEMGTVTAELAQVREAVAKLEDRVRRLEVLAPVSGIVKGLATRTIGAVIAPGEQLMEVVPLDDNLIAEVRISPRDIGHLQIGQEAQVKVTTYDLARFGAIDGKLKYVSASTFEDETGEPFYKGVIELSQSFVGSKAGRNPVLPGMVVDADIQTGSKSLMEYLLRPVYRGLSGAFHER